MGCGRVDLYIFIIHSPAKSEHLRIQDKLLWKYDISHGRGQPTFGLFFFQKGAMAGVLPKKSYKLQISPYLPVQQKIYGRLYIQIVVCRRRTQRFQRPEETCLRPDNLSLGRRLMVEYKFRGSIFKSEEKTPRRCLLGKKGLKTLKHSYGISKIIPYPWPSKI